MFGDKFETATADWPQTKILEKDGAVHITGAYIPPLLPKLTEIFLAVVTIGLPILIGIQAGDVIVGLFSFSFLGISNYFVVDPILQNLFSKNLNLKIFADRIELPGSFGPKKYSREAPIEFRIERHHKALKEEQWEQSKNERQSRTYREAIEVVMQYGEKRIVIAAMLEKEMEKAKALVIRIQNWCKRFDQMGAHVAEGNVVSEDQPIGDFGPEPDVR